MKTLALLISLLAFLILPSVAKADADASTPDMNVDTSTRSCSVPGATVDYAGVPCPPLACDGALCDTSNGGCGAIPGHPTDARSLVFVLGLLLFHVSMRRRRRS